MMRFVSTLFFLGAVMTASAVYAAEDAVAKGTAVARAWQDSDNGFGDNVAEARMILANRQGETAERRMRLLTLEVTDENEGDKSIIIFDHPGDIEGTALLSYAHIREADDQWLYLPALKRVKRISSGNKSGPFVGSEFAYEDITSQELAKFDYKWLRDEACGSTQCSVVEQRPVDQASGYSRQIVWYDKIGYRRQRIDYFDRKDELLKTLTFADYRQYEDKYWRSHEMNMVNHQTGKTTRLVFSSYAFRTGLKDGDFSQNRLEHLQ